MHILELYKHDFHLLHYLQILLYFGDLNFYVVQFLL